MVRLGSRLISEIDGLSSEQFAAAVLADEFAVAHLDLAAHGHDRGAAFNRHAFEAVVVVVDVLASAEIVPR